MKGMLINKETGDLLIEGGSLVVGDPEAQVAEAVVMAMRGEFKEFPLLGGEAIRMAGGVGDVMWSGDVRLMLKDCGVTCNSIKIDNDTVIIS